MAIYLPGTAEDQPASLDEMTPREIVLELDKYVVGQPAAKRAVAIALRNRTRRQKLPPDLAEEIMPKNILMIGSTGVGKTEIARRLAKLTGSPFLKVEASKFTEVGYVGRDVESMIRDLLENAIDMVREEKLEEVEDRAELAAEDRLLDLLLAQTPGAPPSPRPDTSPNTTEPESRPDGAESGVSDVQVSEKPLALPLEPTPPETAPIPEAEKQRDRLRNHFREGKLDDRTVELETRDRAVPQIEIMSNQPPEELGDTSGLKDMLTQMFSQRTRKRPMKVADAFDYLVQEEESRLLDMEQVTRIAIERTEDSGIVFLDEIDKIAGGSGGHGPDISREGVQRDILPIVEGTTVTTKYGSVTTDHILFIAAGAFHVSKPSDLIPELQGRFPIRVELHALTVGDFLRILTEPRASLVKQSIALLETEGLTLEFAPEALEEMARFAFEVNETTENIGARRLHTIMERVLDEISFEAPDLVRAAANPGAPSSPRPDTSPSTTDSETRQGGAESGVPSGRSWPDGAESGVEHAIQAPGSTTPPLTERTTDKGTERVLIIDRAYVEKQVASIVKNQDLSRYIL